MQCLVTTIHYLTLSHSWCTCVSFNISKPLDPCNSGPLRFCVCFSWLVERSLKQLPYKDSIYVIPLILDKFFILFFPLILGWHWERKISTLLNPFPNDHGYTVFTIASEIMLDFLCFSSYVLRLTQRQVMPSWFLPWTTRAFDIPPSLGHTMDLVY